MRTRRDFLKAGGSVVTALLAAGFLDPSEVHAEEWNKAAFDSKKLEDVVKLLGGVTATDSGEVSIDAPDIAENGAVVPVNITSKLDKTRTIAILVEKNPNVLAAMFTIPEGTLPSVQTRVKMAQTCNVFALVKAGGRFVYAAKEIKITLGGCGG